MLRKLIRNHHLVKYCIEVVADLIVCKLLLVCVPFSVYRKRYGHSHCETLQEDMSSALAELKAIKSVLRVIPKYLPWQSKCLEQAMAAKRMLKRRGLQNTLYFGMLRENNNQFVAHAWLRCGKRWIVGYQPNRHYTIVASYAWFGS